MNRRHASTILCAALIQPGLATSEIPQAGETSDLEVTDSRFEKFLQDQATTEHFSGAVLVMQDGKIVHARGYGAATSTSSNHADTAFHVGSLTKQFTAAAILQLAERKVLGLGDPINRHLPAKYQSSRWVAVTVHQLLSHSSGIPDYAVTRDYYRIVKGFCSIGTVDEMLGEAKSKDLEFTPGSKYAYTNLGYTLLGAIIENKTNVSYGEYIQDHILKPLGMMSSRIHVVGQAPLHDEADGFRWSAERGKHVPDEVVSLPATAPDGGLITTLSDFARWARTLAGDKQNVLSEKSIRLMSSPHVRIGNGGPLDSMGYGLYVGDRLIGHSGLIVGFSSQFVYDRDSHSVIAVFSNDVDGNPQQVAFGLLTILLTPKT